MLDESDFNNPKDPGPFPSSHGDEVYLFSADGSGNLTGYSDGSPSAPPQTGSASAATPISVGEVQFPPQRAPDPASAVNAGPRVGPVVLNEIQYAPFPGGVEFVEIANPTAGSHSAL